MENVLNKIFFSNCITGAVNVGQVSVSHGVMGRPELRCRVTSSDGGDQVPAVTRSQVPLVTMCWRATGDTTQYIALGQYHRLYTFTDFIDIIQTSVHLNVIFALILARLL